MRSQCKQQEDYNDCSQAQRRGRLILKTILARAPALDHPAHKLRKHFDSHLLILWLRHSLFQTFQIRKEVMNIRLRELIEQFAMRSQGVLQFDLHAIARE